MLPTLYENQGLSLDMEMKVEISPLKQSFEEIEPQLAHLFKSPSHGSLLLPLLNPITAYRVPSDRDKWFLNAIYDILTKNKVWKQYNSLLR